MYVKHSQCGCCVSGEKGGATNVVAVDVVPMDEEDSRMNAKTLAMSHSTRRYDGMISCCPF